MYQRAIATTLFERLQEPRHTIQIVIGPRQTGKTTAVKQAIKASGLPYRIATADSPFRLNASWITSEWAQARRLAKGQTAVLILDEIQEEVSELCRCLL